MLEQCNLQVFLLSENCKFCFIMFAKNKVLVVVNKNKYLLQSAKLLLY